MVELLPKHVATKEKVLQVLAAAGRPLYDVEELRSLWGPFPPSNIELTRALWDLQKQGEVKFKERKHGRDSLLTAIRLSRGLDTHVFRPNESRGRHPVGRDLTDAKNHHWVAQGGPIEKIHIPPIKEEPMIETHESKWDEYVSKINGDRVRPILPAIYGGTDRPVTIQRDLGLSSARATSLIARGEQLGWIVKERVKGGVHLSLTEEGRRLAEEPFIDTRSDAAKHRPGRPKKIHTPQEYPAQVEVPTLIPDAIPTEMIGAAMGLIEPTQTDTPQEYAPPPTMNTTPWPRIIDVVELDKYPLISELMTKEGRAAAYLAAAKALDGFDDDLALSLLDKIQLAPLEKEVIAFVRSLR